MSTAKPAPVVVKAVRVIKAAAAPAESMRLNKRMADLGLCSRREADDWIEQGWVKVNGQVAAVGAKVVPQDRVEVDKKAAPSRAGDDFDQQTDGLCERAGRRRP
jgi:23S rRNA pseudouridine2604 synthase